MNTYTTKKMRGVYSSSEENRRKYKEHRRKRAIQEGLPVDATWDEIDNGEGFRRKAATSLGLPENTTLDEIREAERRNHAIELGLDVRNIKRLPNGPTPNDTPLSRARLAAGLSQTEAAALAKRWLGKGSTRRWLEWEKPGAKFPPILIQLLNNVKK